MPGDHREEADEDDRERDGQRVPGQQKSQRDDGLRDEEGQHDQGAANQQPGRHVDVHYQFPFDIETLDDFFKYPRDDDHFDQAGQRRRDIDVMVPGQEGHQRCRQDEKRRLQREQVDAGGEPPLRDDGETGE